MNKIRCSVCGKLKTEESFPKNRLLDGTIKVSGDVCNTCMSRKYRKKSKEETEVLKKTVDIESMTILDMVAKLNSMGYVIVKREDFIEYLQKNNNNKEETKKVKT
jgi:hypothetical protein